MTLSTAFDLVVEEFISKPVKKWYGFRNLEEYLLRKESALVPDLQDYRNNAEQLLGWIPLNPSKEEVSRAIKDVYVTHSEGNRIPSVKVFRDLFDKITNSTYKLILIKGNRGIGKTAALNYFFTENSAELISKGYVYFRCDARKIEAVDRAIWKKNSQVASTPSESDDDMEFQKFKNGASLMEYIDAHNIYVALMYSRIDPLLSGFNLIMEGESTGDTSQNKYGEFNLYLKDLRYEGEQKLWRIIADTFIINSEILQDKKTINLRSISMIGFISKIISEIRKSDYSDGLISSFYKFFRTRENFRGVILTIDGVDNFSRIATTGRKYYRKFLEQLRDFIPTDKPNHAFEKIIISLRSESYHELFQEIVSGYSRSSQIDFEVIAPNIRDIISKRIEVANNVLSKEDNNSYYSFVIKASKSNSIFAAFLTEINSFLNHYISAFLERIRNIEFLNSQDRQFIQNDSEEILLEILFCSNVRSMIRNLIGAYAHCRFSFDKVHSRFYENFNIFLSFNHAIIAEGSILLGGRVVENDSNEKSPARRGRWCPPVFSFPRTNDEDIWFGLGIIRVLQFIYYYKASTESKCAKALGDIGYSEELASWFFNRSLMYGLIKVDELSMDSHHVPFQLTKKGIFLINHLFDEEGLIYYLASSAFFPVEFTSNSQYVILHGDNPRGLRDFSRATISVGLCIFRCINEAHRREIETLKSKNPNLNLIECFSLPSHKNICSKWFKRFNKIYTTHNRNQRKMKLTDLSYWRSIVLEEIASDISDIIK